MLAQGQVLQSNLQSEFIMAAQMAVNSGMGYIFFLDNCTIETLL